MADVKISGLPTSTVPLAGTEVLPIVQGGATKQVSVNNLTVGKAVSAASLALTTPLPDSSGGTGLSSLGTGVATFLGTPSSANLAAAVTGETGTGALVFGTNPTFSNTAGASSANFTNSAFQNVVVNLFNASGTVGNTIALQFASNGGATPTNSITSWGSASGGGLDNAIQFGNANGSLRLTTAGDALVTNGNLVIGTSGKGIDFTATPGAGTSELLNDYEEGTWTPTQGAGLTVVGAFSSSGRYIKVGKQVTLLGNVTGATSISYAAAGAPLTAGAPFDQANEFGIGGAFVGTFTTTGANTLISGTSIYADTNMSGSTVIYFQITYFTT